MEGKGDKRGLDTPPGGSSDQPGRRALRNPNIGIIGKTVLDNTEKETLYFIGQCIGRLGHSLTFVPAKGTADILSKGVKEEGGELLTLDRDVIGTADHTLVYPDKRLLSRLLTVYPDLLTQPEVSVIEPDLLNDWKTAITQVLTEKEIPIPE